MREALNGRPADERSRHDYQRVIDAYRRVYYIAPTSAKADPSVVAVAELLAEMGRQFDDVKSSRAAIGQYQFLRHEYPASRHRIGALFTVGEIYKDDLNDPAHAKASFQDFLKKYPHSRLADQAQQAIAEINSDALEAKQDRRSEQLATAASKLLPRVTGVRHWSTPDYTRIAVDVEKDVRFTSERLSHPDRIVFNLHNSKLASVLVGKSFDVEDGFLRRIRVAQYKPDVARIVLEVEDVSKYSAFLLPDPDRLIIDVHGAPPTAAALHVAPNRTRNEDRDSANDASVPAGARIAPVARSSVQPPPALHKAAGPPQPLIKKTINDDDPDTTADITDTAADEVSNAVRDVGPKLSEKPRASAKTKPPDPELIAREAQPNASGDRSLIRALGLKIGKIVIDPGHGGHDTGTIGPHGLREKDLVLDVSLRLGKLLQDRLGADVVYTREDDTFIPLETRTAVANREQADLFVSVHANSSQDPDARGVETYYLNFTSSSDALEVAARENAVSEKSIHELQDLVKKIALKEKIEESREFATDVQRALYTGLALRNNSLRDRGVKKAPFVVLIGANMPSILAEISFVSNPADERRLETPSYRQKIAESLYRGMARYASGLSGVKVASSAGKNEGQ